MSAFDHPRTERVPEVVKAEWPEGGARERVLVATAQRRAIEIRAGLADEHEIVIADPVDSVTELGESPGDVGRHRHRAHLPRLRRGQLAGVVARPNPNCPAGPP